MRIGASWRIGWIRGKCCACPFDQLLALRKGTTLTKEMFLSNLYGGMDEPEMKIIDVVICKLRKKLASASGGTDYIETIWGRGYVMREQDEAATPISA